MDAGDANQHEADSDYALSMSQSTPAFDPRARAARSQDPQIRGQRPGSASGGRNFEGLEGAVISMIPY